MEKDQDTAYLRSVLEKTRTRLLDQTRRNRLVNYKESARDISVINEMPDQVFHHLVTDSGHFYFDFHPEAEDEDEQRGLIEESKPERTLPR